MANLTATTYSSIANFLDGHYERKIGHNTLARSNSYNKSYEILLHNHRIVTLFDDKMNFSMCGYGTVTTRERLNQFLISIGFRVYQHKGEQVLYNLGNGKKLPIDPYVEYSIVNDEVFDTGSIMGVEKSPIKVL